MKETGNQAEKIETSLNAAGEVSPEKETDTVVRTETTDGGTLAEQEAENMWKGEEKEAAGAFPIISNLLLSLVLDLFLLSPVIQLVWRMYQPIINFYPYHEGFIRYKKTIQMTNRVTFGIAVAICVGVIVYHVDHRTDMKKQGKDFRGIFTKKWMGRLAPYWIFVLFAGSILLSTFIRGASQYDLRGHIYMFESIFFYIFYALGYFFCGMLVFNDKVKRMLLYHLIAGAIPLHILALVNEWGNQVTYFYASGVTTVFSNSNHYGYFLVVTILAAAMLFVYDERIIFKFFSSVCAMVGIVVLIVNNTLGAYLAVLFVLILFIIYCFAITKEHKAVSLIMLAVYLLITFGMSFKYNTVMSSLITVVGDVGNIVDQPLEADGGSGRWSLWVGTVQHLMDHPFVGFGVEGLLDTYDIQTPHNEFLQYAEFFGYPTMLFYIAASGLVLWRVFRNIKNMSKSTIICFFICIGYLASSFVGVAIFYTTPFFYIILGLCYAEFLRYGKEGERVMEDI